MDLLRIKCSYCRQPFYRHKNRINEAKRFGWKSYCSFACIGMSRDSRKKLNCSNPNCNKIFLRQRNQCKGPNIYCSQSCAAKVNNLKYPKRHGVVKQCANCNKNFISRKKYCSKVCKNLGSRLKKEFLIEKIQAFVQKHKRIPLKREFTHYKAVRGRFGTWNNAIIQAGYIPNPVMFANKQIAKDGHICDSIAEKIIDDYLSRRHIKHVRNYPYPGAKGFTVDFKVKDYWIEFFGLTGELKRYDKLRRRKLNLIKKYHLNLIDIYPRDIYPKSKLGDILTLNKLL